MNVMLTRQAALTARLAGHGLAEMEKSPELVMELIVTASEPELVMLKLCAELVVLRFCAGNVSEVGETVIVGVPVELVTGMVSTKDLARCNTPLTAAEACRNI